MNWIGSTDSFPWATWMIAALNVGVFFAVHQATGFGPEVFGALDPVRVWQGEVWRFFSAIFIHGGLLHLAFNTFVMVQVGRILEPVISSPRLVLLYLMCGITSFAASLLINSSQSVGSSGAVFGLIGALFALVLSHPPLFDKAMLRSLLIFVGVNIGLGFLINGWLGDVVMIDNAAHLSGLAMGFLLGVGFLSDFFGKFSPKFVRLCMGTGFAACFLTVLMASGPTFLPEYQVARVQHALAKGDLKLAAALSQELGLKKDGRSELLLARIHALSGRTEQAASYFAKAAILLSSENDAWQMALSVLYPELESREALFVDEKTNQVLCTTFLTNSKLASRESLNDCAWLLLMARDQNIHDPKQALVWALDAVKRSKPVPPHILHTLAEAYSQNGQNEEAMAAIMRAMVISGPDGGRIFQKDKERFELLAKNSAHRFGEVDGNQ